MYALLTVTALLGSMNRQMNLPALQRIAQEFEKENDIMDQRQEMMDDAIDDATGMEDEEESEDVVNQVLDEIGIDLGQAVDIALLIHRLTANLDRWVRHLAACRRMQRLRGEWRKQSGVPMLTTITFRLVLTASGDDETTSSQTCDIADVAARMRMAMRLILPCTLVEHARWPVKGSRVFGSKTRPVASQFG